MQRYLLDHTTWYVPDLDMSSNSTIKAFWQSQELGTERERERERDRERERERERERVCVGE